MTQGKKKKRVNRSLLLAKKIIIKDGGTVSPLQTFYLADFLVSSFMMYTSWLFILAVSRCVSPSVWVECLKTCIWFHINSCPSLLLFA